MDDIELAVAAAEAGAEVVRNRLGTPLTRIGKGGGDFATDVDFEAERTIIELLLAKRPTDRVVAEESGPLGDPGADRRWLVDPLCGTLNFAARFGPRVVSTSLALAWVASGQRAAYVTDGQLEGSVHFTAGIALCVAAGCVVTNLKGGPIHTGVGGLIAVADTATHEALCAMTKRQLHQRI